MPTGYTAFIEDGTVTTSKDFLKLCSRAFGVYKNYPDEPLSPDIPTVLVKDPKYEQNVADAKAALDEAIHETDWETKLSAYVDEKKTDYEDYKTKYDELRTTYRTIRAGIQNWDSQDLFKPLKEFALNQIDISVNSLTKPEFYLREYDYAKSLTADQYKDRTLKQRSETLADAIKWNQKADSDLTARQRYLDKLLEFLQDL